MNIGQKLGHPIDRVVVRLNVKHQIGLAIAYAQYHQLERRVLGYDRAGDVAQLDGLFFQLELLVQFVDVLVGENNSTQLIFQVSIEFLNKRREQHPIELVGLLQLGQRVSVLLGFLVFLRL